MSTEYKETKAHRHERLKRQKNPWDCLDEIRGFARDGFGSIPPEWLSAYFRWWGIYTQGDGAGAVGGRGGEGKALPYFMVRIRIPNGLLNSRQVRTLAQISARHARGVADITVRQNIQLHWVTVESLPEVFESLWSVGLTTMGACGDDTRNIIGCPLAGVDATEICDASPLVFQATEQMNGNPEFYNLPRKFKICITGCRVWCSYPEINDIGLTAIRRSGPGGEEIGFSLRVGGGLSTDPHLGVRMKAFIRWNQVLPVIKIIAEIFRDADGLRESRERARLKFLFLRHGCTEEIFRKELERRLGYALDPDVAEDSPTDVFRDHVGVHPQRQEGLSYVGASVLRGRITPVQLETVAELAERYAGGEIRTTNMQNMLMINVPDRHTERLAAALTGAGLPVAGSSFRRGAVACTGTEFCKLAITETKGFTRWLVEELDTRLPGFDQHIRLNVTGCPNSCGQHWIADIGIEGKKIKEAGRFVDAYYFCVGGAVGRHQAIARPVGYRCLASEVPETIERLLRHYLGNRRADENFRAFAARHSDDEIRTLLAGSETPAVARDIARGPAPLEVRG
ncbi:MAG: nitrite/sulfite reductase [Acidobacteria bacterium]|nr:nitrite/sulfite reductase [Acidobacteriota bacterium]